MSGPKVVRVRWVVAESLAALDELETIVQEWAVCLRRHGHLTQERLSEAESSLREALRLHENGQWRKASASARAACESLRREVSEIREEAIQRVERARDRRRRMH